MFADASTNKQKKMQQNYEYFTIVTLNVYGFRGKNHNGNTAVADMSTQLLKHLKRPCDVLCLNEVWPSYSYSSSSFSSNNNSSFNYNYFASSNSSSNNNVTSATQPKLEEFCNFFNFTNYYYGDACGMLGNAILSRYTLYNVNLVKSTGRESSIPTNDSNNGGAFWTSFSSGNSEVRSVLSATLKKKNNRNNSNNGNGNEHYDAPLNCTISALHLDARDEDIRMAQLRHFQQFKQCKNLYLKEEEEQSKQQQQQHQFSLATTNTAGADLFQQTQQQLEYEQAKRMYGLEANYLFRPPVHEQAEIQQEEEQGDGDTNNSMMMKNTIHSNPFAKPQATTAKHSDNETTSSNYHPQFVCGDFNSICKDDYTSSYYHSHVFEPRRRSHWELPRFDVYHYMTQTLGYEDCLRMTNSAEQQQQQQQSINEQSMIAQEPEFTSFKHAMDTNIVTCAYDTRIDYIFAKNLKPKEQQQPQKQKQQGTTTSATTTTSASGADTSENEWQLLSCEIIDMDGTTDHNAVVAYFGRKLI